MKRCVVCGDRTYRKEMCRAHFLATYRGPGRRRGNSPRLGPAYGRPIVYAWFAPDGTAEYVGRGRGRRPYAHRHAAWWTDKHFLVSLGCGAEWEAMMKEGEWIGRYLPRHNIEGLRQFRSPQNHRNSTGTAS